MYQSGWNQWLSAPSVTNCQTASPYIWCVFSSQVMPKSRDSTSSTGSRSAGNSRYAHSRTRAIAGKAAARSRPPAVAAEPSVSGMSGEL